MDGALLEQLREGRLIRTQSEYSGPVGLHFEPTAGDRIANVGGGVMRIIAFDKFRPGVTMDQITPYLPQEVANVWRLWKAGIVRENYARADESGVVIVFEVADVAAARRYTDDFPLSKAGLLEWSFIALQVPLPIETLFRQDVDLNQPYDRTLGGENQKKGAA